MRNLPLLATLMERQEFRGRVLGLHLEGPFISDQPGAVGAHNPIYVQTPDIGLLSALLDQGKGHVRLLTVAAELPGIEDVVAAAYGSGVAVSVGHSVFTTANLDRAYAAGARSLTHLGNGLPNLLPRHPNPMWAGLAHDGFTAMLIADGHHLPSSFLKTAARTKGSERIVVVSDASPVAGFPPGEYDVLGNRAVLEPSGRLYNPEKQCLVGSTAMMADCVAYLRSQAIFDEDELTRIAVVNPLNLIGLTIDDVSWSAAAA
jgi:N-acetylglucosamine-6-phosphate deacetylase